MANAESTSLTDYLKIEPIPDAENWLTAFHVVYSSNEDEVSSALRHLYQKVRPVAGVLSCYHNEDPSLSNTGIAKRVCPFPNESLRTIRIDPQIMPSNQSVANRDMAAVCQEWGYFPENYSNIFWKWRIQNTAFLTYTSESGHQVEAERIVAERSGGMHVERQRRTETIQWPQGLERRIEDERIEQQRLSEEERHHQLVAQRAEEERRRREEAVRIQQQRRLGEASQHPVKGEHVAAPRGSEIERIGVKRLGDEQQ